MSNKIIRCVACKDIFIHEYSIDYRVLDRDKCVQCLTEEYDESGKRLDDLRRVTEVGKLSKLIS